MTKLSAKNITVKSGAATLVQSASFTLGAGELVAILGPNGAGKTTLLRAVLGLQNIASGFVHIGDAHAHSLSAYLRARQIAYLPQIRPLAWPSRVWDIVALGRFSHGANLSRLRGADLDAVTRALSACDIMHLKDRHADTLSGGELARMHCARAFAAQAPLLIADEPVAALDPRHQFRVMDLIKDYVDNGGGAFVVLHDIALAAKYADRLIWMKAGQIIAEGSPTETVTEARLANIYGVKATVRDGLVQIDGAL